MVMTEKQIMEEIAKFEAAKKKKQVEAKKKKRGRKKAVKKVVKDTQKIPFSAKFQKDYIKFREKGAWPVRADIVEQRAGALMIRKGKGRRIQKKDGFVYYRIKTGILRRPIKTKPVQYEHLYITKGGYQTYLYSPSPDQYIPLELDVDKGKLKAIDEDLRLFLVDSIIDSQTRFKPLTFMHKYFPVIAIVMVAVSIAVILFASADMLQTSAGTISQSASILEKVQGSISGVQSV